MISLLNRRTAPERLEQLRAAISARDEAVKAIRQARETLERLESIVRASDAAGRAAADAANGAREARHRWVREGCRHSESRQLQTLDEAAAEASRVAQRATRDAEAVNRAELARAQDAVQSAQIAVQHREDEITNARAAIIIEWAGPVGERYVASAIERCRARLEFEAVAQLTYPWSSDPNAVRADEKTYEIIKDFERRGAVQSWDNEIDRYSAGSEALLEQLNQRKQFWRSRAKSLLAETD